MKTVFATRNRKGVIKTMALILLLFGVTSGSAIIYTVTAGGATARTELQRTALDKINDMEGMKIFYNDLMLYATEDALEELGYSLDKFCPLGVEIDQELEDQIIESGADYLDELKSYKTYSLPPLENGGTADFEIIAEEDYLEVSGISPSKLVVETGGIKISSNAVFSNKIYFTEETEPDLELEKVKISKGATEIGIAGGGGTVTGVSSKIQTGDTVTITASIKNIGCGDSSATKVNFYTIEPNYYKCGFIHEWDADPNFYWPRCSEATSTTSKIGWTWVTGVKPDVDNNECLGKELTTAVICGGTWECSREDTYCDDETVSLSCTCMENKLIGEKDLASLEVYAESEISVDWTPVDIGIYDILVKVEPIDETITDNNDKTIQIEVE